MNEILQEFADSRGLAMQFDRQQAVIRGVKILGVESRNGRSYLPEALAAGAPLYEGAKVNVNHPKGNPLAPRDYQDRIGVIRAVAVRAGQGLFADFHFNPKHALAEQLLWDAEHAPENVGFSHHVEARTARQGDRVVVEAILKVQSVDLVADPATTRGLFEALPAGAAPLAALTLEALKHERPDLVDALEAERSAELARLKGELEALRLAEALRARREVARRLLAEFQLPSPEAADPWGKVVVSEEFLARLVASPDEAAMRRLVEERARQWEAARRFEPGLSRVRPVSREQLAAERVGERVDGAGFARAIAAGNGRGA